MQDARLFKGRYPRLDTSDAVELTAGDFTPGDEVLKQFFR